MSVKIADLYKYIERIIILYDILLKETYNISEKIEENKNSKISLNDFALNEYTINLQDQANTNKKSLYNLRNDFINELHFSFYNTLDTEELKEIDEKLMSTLTAIEANINNVPELPPIPYYTTKDINYKKKIKKGIQYEQERLLYLLKTGGNTPEEDLEIEEIKKMYNEDPKKDKYTLEEYVKRHVKRNSIFYIKDVDVLKSVIKEKFGHLMGSVLPNNDSNQTTLKNADYMSQLIRATIYELGFFNTLGIMSNLYYTEGMGIDAVTNVMPEYTTNTKFNQTNKVAFQGYNEDMYDFKVPVQDGKKQFNETRSYIGNTRSKNMNTIAQGTASAISMLNDYQNAFNTAKKINKALVMIRKDGNTKYFCVWVPKHNTMEYKPALITDIDELIRDYKEVVIQMLCDEKFNWGFFD